MAKHTIFSVTPIFLIAAVFTTACAPSKKGKPQTTGLPIATGTTTTGTDSNTSTGSSANVGNSTPTANSNVPTAASQTGNTNSAPGVTADNKKPAATGQQQNNVPPTSNTNQTASTNPVAEVPPAGQSKPGATGSQPANTPPITPVKPAETKTTVTAPATATTQERPEFIPISDLKAFTLTLHPKYKTDAQEAKLLAKLLLSTDKSPMYVRRLVSAKDPKVFHAAILDQMSLNSGLGPICQLRFVDASSIKQESLKLPRNIVMDQDKGKLKNHFYALSDDAQNKAAPRTELNCWLTDTDRKGKTFDIDFKEIMPIDELNAFMREVFTIATKP